MTDLFDASAAREPAGKPGAAYDMVEVQFRPPARLDRFAFAGPDARQVAAAVLSGLPAKPSDITALADGDHDARCWVVFAPSGLRLARVGGMSAHAFNHALAALDADRLERTAA